MLHFLQMRNSHKKDKLMTVKPKIRIVVDEDESIVLRLDAIAESEGIARSDILRRAIRRLLFSMPNVLTDEKFPSDQRPATEQVAA